MSTLADYEAAMRVTPIDDHPRLVWALLSAVYEAWTEAEGGIPSENESRRWSPVCDAALRLIGGAS